MARKKWVARTFDEEEFSNLTERRQKKRFSGGMRQLKEKGEGRRTKGYPIEKEKKDFSQAGNAAQRSKGGGKNFSHIK